LLQGKEPADVTIVP